MFLVYPESSCEMTVLFLRFLEELIDKPSWFHVGRLLISDLVIFMQIKFSDFVCLLGYI